MDEKQKHRLVYNFSIVGCATLILFGLVYILQQNFIYGLTEIFLGLAGLINLAIFYQNKNFKIASWGVLSIMSVVLMFLLNTGGLSDTGVFWFFVFPLLSLFLRGSKEGALWVVGIFLVIGEFMLIDAIGYNVTVYSFETLRQLLASLFVVSLFVYIYEKTNEDTLHTVAIEVTKKKNAQREISDQKAKEDVILANIGEGIVALDKNGVILYVNQVACDLLGYQRDELVGNKFDTTIEILDKAKKPAEKGNLPLNIALKGKKVVTRDFYYVRKNGTSFPVSLTANPLLRDNFVFGAVGVFRDITEEKELDKVKTEFVTLASHQLRTPLAGIAWHMELLLDNDLGKLTQEQKEHAKQVYESNRRLIALVNSLLNVSQIEMNNYTIRPEPILINDIAELEIQEMQKDYDDKKLKIVKNLDPKIGPLQFDEAAAKLIFFHLLSNAFEYTPNAGKISVMTKKIDNGIKISVSDNGIGIPTNEKSKIFNKLFRGEGGGSHNPNGSGLGLYVVKHIIEFVKGQIWFESEVGKGSTFFVILPLGMKENIANEHFYM